MHKVKARLCRESRQNGNPSDEATGQGTRRNAISLYFVGTKFKMVDRDHEQPTLRRTKTLFAFYNVVFFYSSNFVLPIGV